MPPKRTNVNKGEIFSRSLQMRNGLQGFRLTGCGWLMRGGGEERPLGGVLREWENGRLPS